MANPWSGKYLYYTNEHPSFNSVMKIDFLGMTLKANIHVWGLNPHSVDRACNTDKMYVRTQSSYSFSVIDARTEKFIKTVALPFKPRTCGDQNYKYNLQLVGGTSDPGVALIDVNTDEVIFVDWEPANGRKALGNQGGSAAGHAVWFDDLHFGYLNRLSSEIKIFQIISGEYARRVTHVQTLKTPTALHSIQDDKIDVSLTEKTLYGALEGYKGDSQNPPVTPGIVKYSWNPNRSDMLRYVSKITLPQSNSTDTIHHYTITSNKQELWVPTFNSRKTHRIRLSDFKVIASYNSGYGGGHVNFSDELNLAVITNHFDYYITVIDRHTGATTSVKVNNNKDIANTGKLLQTHSNWVVEDGRYFIVGNSHDGDFVKVDLRFKILKYRLFVGGHPEQSIS